MFSRMSSTWVEDTTVAVAPRRRRRMALRLFDCGRVGGSFGCAARMMPRAASLRMTECGWGGRRTGNDKGNNKSRSRFLASLGMTERKAKAKSKAKAVATSKTKAVATLRWGGRI